MRFLGTNEGHKACAPGAHPRRQASAEDNICQHQPTRRRQHSSRAKCRFAKQQNDKNGLLSIVVARNNARRSWNTDKLFLKHAAVLREACRNAIAPRAVRSDCDVIDDRRRTRHAHLERCGKSLSEAPLRSRGRSLTSHGCGNDYACSH